VIIVSTFFFFFCADIMAHKLFIGECRPRLPLSPLWTCPSAIKNLLPDTPFSLFVGTTFFFSLRLVPPQIAGCILWKSLPSLPCPRPETSSPEPCSPTLPEIREEACGLVFQRSGTQKKGGFPRRGMHNTCKNYPEVVGTKDDLFFFLPR